jgi:hypothetical protein
VLVWAGLFTFGVLYSDVLWKLLAGPVVQALRDQRIEPPVLLATSPWQQAFVIWLGIPFLFAAFGGYPVSVLVASRSSISPALKAIAVSSAMLYTAGFAAGFLAWQFGSFRWVLPFLLQSQHAEAVSITQCFGFLAASTLGTALASQVPLVLLHSRHSRAGRP